MSGIVGVVTKSQEPTSELRLMSDEMVRLRNSEKFRFEQNIFGNVALATMSNLAFSDKKGVYSDSDLAVVFDGVLFNTNELGFDNDVKYPEIAARFFKEHGEEFVQKLRGNFVLAIYDKHEQVLRIYTDPFSSKPIYYFINGDDFYFCSELKGLLPVGRSPKTVNKLALIDSFALGYVCGNKTFVKEIERLPAGSYIKYDVSGLKLELKSYYEIDNEPLDLTEAEFMERLKEDFFKAVDRGMRTTTYSYSPLVALSGGLDSRACIAVANKLGYSHIHSLTFAEADSEDAIYAQKVARALSTHHLFQSYDNGNWLIDNINQNVSNTDGMYHYIDSAKVVFGLSAIDTSKFGILHMGISGDTVIGGKFIIKNDLSRSNSNFSEDELVNALMKRICIGRFQGIQTFADQMGKEILFRLKESIGNSLYSNNINLHGEWVEAIEKWTILNREIRGYFGHFRTAEECSMEFFSPFYDLDFFNIAMKIPNHYKYGESIYIKLLLKIFSDELCDIPTQTTGTKLKKNIQRMKLEGRLRKILHLVLQRFSDNLRRKSSTHPYLYWVCTNKRLRDFIREELADFIEIESLHIDRAKFIKFLNEWHNDPRQYRSCLLNLIYLLSLKKWFNLFGEYVSN